MALPPAKSSSTSTARIATVTMPRASTLPNLRSPGVQNATPGELAWLLRNGNMTHRMPPWAGIPEQRRWQIVAFVKSLGVETKSTASNTVAAPDSASR